MKTAADIAQQEGKTIRVVQRHCAAVGMPKTAGVYVFVDDEWEQRVVESLRRAKRGRPSTVETQQSTARQFPHRLR